MPIGRPFVGMGQREHGRLRKRSTGDLQTYRKTGRGKSARHADRGKPRYVEWPSIARPARVETCARRNRLDRRRRTPHRWRDEEIDGGERVLDLAPDQLAVAPR